MVVTRRPMRPEEAIALGSAPAYHWRFHGLGFSLFGGGALGAIVLVVLQVVGIRDNRQSVLSVATFGIASALLWWSHQRRLGAVYRTAAQQRQVDRSGDVEEWRVKVADAIEVEEWGDLGLNFYLALEDGRVLFLSGQYLYDDVEAGRFPNRDLVLVWSSGSRMLLDLRCEGEPFAASSKLPSFTRPQHRAGEVPRDGDILAGPLSRFRARP